MLRKQAATVYEMDQLERQSEFLFKNLDFKKNLNFLEIGAHTGHFLLHLKNNMDCMALRNLFLCLRSNFFCYK